MLTAYRQQQFIEKILTDSFGRQYRVLFAVSFVDGEIRGRVVSATPLPIVNRLTGHSYTGSTCVYLPAANSNNKIFAEYRHAFIPIVSPYIELYFFTSQPTRAPSHE